MAPFLIHMGDLGMELLTKKGEKFYIDEADYALVCQYVWYLSARGYITTTLQRNGRKNPCQLNLHRLLIPTDGSVDIDHINGNKLDNRRSNLRVCTHWENSCNQRKRCTNTTGFTGVSYLKCAKKYEAVNCNSKLNTFIIHNDSQLAYTLSKKLSKSSSGV